MKQYTQRTHMNTFLPGLPLDHLWIKVWIKTIVVNRHVLCMSSFVLQDNLICRNAADCGNWHQQGIHTLMWCAQKHMSNLGRNSRWCQEMQEIMKALRNFTPPLRQEVNHSSMHLYLFAVCECKETLWFLGTRSFCHMQLRKIKFRFEQFKHSKRLLVDPFARSGRTN